MCFAPLRGTKTKIPGWHLLQGRGQGGQRVLCSAAQSGKSARFCGRADGRACSSGAAAAACKLHRTLLAMKVLQCQGRPCICKVQYVKCECCAGVANRLLQGSMPLTCPTAGPVPGLARRLQGVARQLTALAYCANTPEGVQRTAVATRSACSSDQHGSPPGCSQRCASASPAAARSGSSAPKAPGGRCALSCALLSSRKP